MFAHYGHFYLLLLLTLSMNSDLLLIEKHSAENILPECFPILFRYL